MQFNPTQPTLPGFACGDFQLKAKDGTIMNGRSMEFLIPQGSKILTFNPDEKFESTAPNGTKGLEWTSSIGFTGMAPFNFNGVVDGLNEKGLSFGALTLQETKYQEVKDGEEKKALALTDVGNWILGNFATVAEVKEAIKDVIIWGQFIKQMNSVPGLHIALHDATGKNGVIEVIDGEVRFYDNEEGVLTNDPQLFEQIENMEKYNHITPEHGMIGIPGDWSSVSRFVRISLMTKFAEPKDKDEAFNEATHILNSTDIPTGVATKTIKDHTFTDRTLWSCIKDLTNRILYFRSHNDMTFRAIDLTKVQFKKGIPHTKYDVQVEKPTIIDITNQLSPQPHWLYGLAKVAPQVNYSPLKEISSDLKFEEITKISVNEEKKESLLLDEVKEIKSDEIQIDVKLEVKDEIEVEVTINQ